MSDKLSEAINVVKSEIKVSPEFVDLEKAFKEMQKDDVAFGVYSKFQEANMKLRQQQMMGQEITEEDYKDLENQAKAMQGIEVIGTLMQKEKALGEMMDKLTNDMSEPIIQLYQGGSKKD